MIRGTLEHAIYLEECRQLTRMDELNARAQIEDWIAESPVQLCIDCNTPFCSLGEARCETCMEEQHNFHFDHNW